LLWNTVGASVGVIAKLFNLNVRSNEPCNIEINQWRSQDIDNARAHLGYLYLNDLGATHPHQKGWSSRARLPGHTLN
jgi:hypothetical protein